MGRERGSTFGAWTVFDSLVLLLPVYMNFFETISQMSCNVDDGRAVVSRYAI